MQEASFMGLLRTLLIIWIFYHLGKFFFKYVAPVLLANYVKNKAGQQQGRAHNYNTPKEGTTTIDKKPEQKNTSNNSVGEYVDYEEVD